MQVPLQLAGDQNSNCLTKSSPSQNSDQFEKSRTLAGLIIKSQDPKFCELIAQTTFVSVYKFDDHSSQWSRADVEGFLFLIRRSEYPRFKLIILNQRNQTNLMEEINETWDLSFEKHYIFYRRRDEESGSLVTRGLWFFDDNERERIRVHLQRTIERTKRVAAPWDYVASDVTNEMITSLLRRLLNSTN